MRSKTGSSTPAATGRRARFQPPVMRRHTGRRQARVRVDGKTIWLGPWEDDKPSPEAVAKFEVILDGWMKRRKGLPAVDQAEPTPEAAAATPTAPPVPQTITVAELLDAYRVYAETYYRRPDGTLSSSMHGIQQAVRAMSPFLDTPAQAFGPLKLATVIEQLVDQGTLCRKTINAVAKTIRRIYRWGVSRELLPGACWESLRAAELLKQGRTTARESKRVPPVEDAVVNKTLPHLPPVVRDMVQFQRRTGARPGEVCNLTTGDIDTTGDVWIATLIEHKTSYAGRAREITIGPKAQAILQRYLPRAADAAVFSPQESEAIRHREQRARRKSRVQPSQQSRRKPRPRRPATEFYTTASYRRAIARACERSGVPHWAPNQLRHTAATEVRKKYGLEAAQVTLGHATANITQVYAERDRELARRVAREVG